jgi:mono/diheme cytochrome c family protein
MAVVASALESASAAAGPPAAERMEAGKRLYLASCAACHGSDGRGLPVATVGFETPLPDFTDCGFATREPNEDWLAVVHDGGPARAFDRMMPAFGDALTLEEMELILGYMRAFCDDDDWPRGELNLPRLLVTTKAYPEDEAVLSVAADTEGRGVVSPTLVYERRIGARNQVEVAVPFVFSERAAGGWIGGVGDIALSAKRALYHGHEAGSILSLALELVLPTGDADRGSGGGSTVFEPFVAFGQILPSSAFLQFQSGIELPADRDRTDAAFARIALGKTFVQGRFGRSWSPMVELLAARDLGSSEDAQWDVVPQLQVSLSTRQHVLVSGGVRVPLNDTQLRETRFIAYVLWDWFDGALLSGW